jgi:2-isopropylmalate synthase
VIRNDYFIVRGYRVVTERFTERRCPIRALVEVQVGDRLEKHEASGVGPVHALDNALRRCLRHAFPEMEHVRLSDYRVSVVDADQSTAAKVHVSIRATNGHESWDAGCVSNDIIDASFEALCETAVLGIMRIRGAYASA